MVAVFAGRVYEPAQAEEVPALTAEQIAALEARAFDSAAAPDGLSVPESIPVEIRRGESFEDAIQRAGISESEAEAVAATISTAYDVEDIRAGVKFETAVAQPRSGRGEARLIGLTMRTGPASQLTVSRSFDGALRLRALDERVTEETVVARAELRGSLSATLQRAGGNARMARQLTRMFASRMDLSRNLRAGDDVMVVFDRKVTEAGRTVETSEVLAAQVKGQMVYRFRPPGARDYQYFDASGSTSVPNVMGAPIGRARISSTFGFRRHPIAGFRKMHQGIDFAAPTGTAVLAPSDGVVVEARRWGGYGNWLRIRHANGLESGYGHLSRYGSGIRAGQRVTRGQVVAYVGSTGASTGPHLHYEIWRNGERINPNSIRTGEDRVQLSGAALAAFRAEKTRIDRIIAAGGARRPANGVQQAAAQEGLRPADA